MALCVHASRARSCTSSSSPRAPPAAACSRSRGTKAPRAQAPCLTPACLRTRGVALLIRKGPPTGSEKPSATADSGSPSFVPVPSALAAESGSRLKAKWLVAEDGARYFTFNWYDRERGHDCSFLLAADGVQRCLPPAAATTVAIASLLALGARIADLPRGVVVMHAGGQPEDAAVVQLARDDAVVDPRPGRVDGLVLAWVAHHPTLARFSGITRGLRAAMRKSASPGPSGFVRACSQLRSVCTLSPSARANCSCVSCTKRRRAAMSPGSSRPAMMRRRWAPWRARAKSVSVHSGISRSFLGLDMIAPRA